MVATDDSGMGTLIDQALKLKFKNSAKGVADVGRKHFSQAVQMIAICRAVDLSKLDTLEKRKALERSDLCMSIGSNSGLILFCRVHSSIQTALDGVIVKKGGSAAQSPHEILRRLWI